MDRLARGERPRVVYIERRFLVIDITTPWLDHQQSLFLQIERAVAALEAALRLRNWWNENAELLRACLMPQPLRGAEELCG